MAPNLGARPRAAKRHFHADVKTTPPGPPVLAGNAGIPSGRRFCRGLEAPPRTTLCQ